jgi:N-acyl-D-amino-acid deacylase
VVDLVISALVVDGTGAPPFSGWVAVRGRRISDVGRPGDPLPTAGRSIVMPEAVVSPGFVDVHNHSDLAPLLLPEMPSVVRQGVTSVIVGNCGLSPWPLAGWDEALRLVDEGGRGGRIEVPAWATWGAYLDAIELGRPSVNVGTLVGHGSLRREVMGSDRGRAGQEATDRMAATAASAVAEGALGVSTGLIYVPGLYAGTEELVRIAEAVGREGGLYASHIRGEGRDLFAAVDEAIEIGRRAGLPAHVSHLKCESSRVWGRTDELLARFHGQEDVTCDQYPYAAWNSSLSSLLPAWAPVEDLARVAASEPERLREAVEEGEPGFQSSVDGVGWDRIVIVAAGQERWQGLDMAAIGEAMGVRPFDAMVRLLLDDPDTSCIGHAMDPDDVLAILGDAEVFVASDGAALDPTGPQGALPVHPREYGTFPRALALARDRGLLPLETVVRKMTSLPAGRFGLRDRGVIRPGAFADLVVFDAESIRDEATFERPHAYPTGIDLVVVNGTVAWEQDSSRIQRAGTALRRT